METITVNIVIDSNNYEVVYAGARNKDGNPLGVYIISIHQIILNDKRRISSEVELKNQILKRCLDDYTTT